MRNMPLSHPREEGALCATGLSLTLRLEERKLSERGETAGITLGLSRDERIVVIPAFCSVLHFLSVSVSFALNPGKSPM